MTWKEREQARLDDGTYKPLPVILAYPKDHFVHLSITETENDYVAYTPSEAYGEADRQVRLKFGRYLRKVFATLTDAEIQAHVTGLKSSLAVVEQPATLHFATDRATINDIFETEMNACGSSCSSCMHGKFDGDEIRPYHVYADSPDVAVAYVTTGKGIVSRSVVSTKKKVWVRCYSLSGGDNDADCGTLRQLLKDAGYDKGDLIGNRLTKLPETNRGKVVLPYIDNGGAHVSDRGNYWVVVHDGEGDYAADNTDGTGTETNRCERCEHNQDDCQCIYCECCDESYADGCDACSMCEVCERCTEHERCGCARCGDCGHLLEGGRYITTCDCERCEECSELTDDCDCERCDACNRLTVNCECPSAESETEPVVVPDLVMTRDQIREKLNRIYVYLRDNHGAKPTDDNVLSVWTVLRKALVTVEETEARENAA